MLASCVVVSEIMTGGRWWRLRSGGGCSRGERDGFFNSPASWVSTRLAVLSIHYWSHSFTPASATHYTCDPELWEEEGLFFSYPNRGDDTAVCLCKPLIDTFPKKKKQQIVKKKAENANLIITPQFQCSAVGEGKVTSQPLFWTELPRQELF